MDFINKIFRGDRVIWMIFLFLCLISIVEVFSATSTLAYRRNYWEPIMEHTMFLLVGMGIVLLAHSIKPQFFGFLVFFLPITWILLIITKIFGTSINGADRWFSIFGISFQPSEIAKLTLIITVAYLLSQKKNFSDDKIFKYILIATVPTCFIIMLDNFSTALLLFSIVFIMMFIGRIPFKRLGQLLAVFAVFGVISVSLILFLSDNNLKKVFPRGLTWKERIKDYTYKDTQPSDEQFVINDDNYQVSHAKIAIARGSIFGKMPGNSQERDFLPQAYSDFIYAIIIEELGLIGGMVVLLLYVILFFRAGIIASRSDNIFAKYLVMGCALIIVFQALVNMSVAVNLIPVTGQPLPLISRGGTSTLISCFFIGIILSVSRFENPKGIMREQEILSEAELKLQQMKQQETEEMFMEENINAGEV